MATEPTPTEIRLRTESRCLTVSFDDGKTFDLSFEYLRAHSPSAAVKGHGSGPGVLQLAKEFVQIKNVEPVGRYAVRLVFDDGHDSGLYSWSYLYELGRDYDQRWAAYLDRLTAFGYARRTQTGSQGT